MSDKSKIEWTDATWNPIRGCSRVSEGCRNCYAERQAARFSGRGQPYEGLAERVPVTKDTGGKFPQVLSEPRWTGAVRLAKDQLELPLHWQKPRKIFVCSMSDLFHEKVPDEWIDRIFWIMEQVEWHTFQILTKRAQRMLAWHRRWTGGGKRFPQSATRSILPNVWLGVSVEDQKAADQRIPLLLQTPAAVRWVSYEPALGPLDLDGYLGRDIRVAEDVTGDGLDWVVCGGESGPGARPMQPDWARSVRDQCKAAGVPFFFKQWGAWAWQSQITKPLKVRDRTKTLDLDQRSLCQRAIAIGKKAAGRLLDGREWNEFPR